MKLIRLATDNDAKFDANFTTTIDIEKNSKIALLNMTLEKEFQAFVIGNNNRLINGNYPDGILLDGQDAFIPRVVIDTQDEQDTFLHQLSGALNGTLLDTNNTETTINQGVYGGAEYIARRGINDSLVEIVLQLTPLLPPFLKLKVNTAGLPDTEKGLFSRKNTIGFRRQNCLTLLDALNKNVNVGDRFHQLNGFAKSTDRTNCFTLNDGVNFCRGSGTIAFQIEDSNDNGLGAAGTTNNGFGIGLCIGVDELPLDANDKLLDADVDYEVYFNRIGENYSSIVGKGNARTLSAIAPGKVRLAGHPNAETHDYLGITIEENIIVGFVSKDDGSYNLFTPLQLTDQQVLDIQKFGIKAYFYFNDDDTGIKICNARVSASPFVNEGFFQSNDNKATFIGDRDMAVTGLPGNLYNALPYRFNPANALAVGPMGRFNPNRAAQDFTLTLDEGIQEYLGFSPNERIRGTHIPVNGFVRFSASRQIAFNFSDFYIVESQTLPLDSYNAVPDERLNPNVNREQALKFPLKGERKNILATIPINEGAGQVEYETNTPQFIDIKNINETNIRNLKFRILDKNFEELKTANTTNMTILIKGPNE
tara:strand:- start:46 stop:1824 length:1779 start_codon:yes stop_codon:yes gene_type:complete